MSDTVLLSVKEMISRAFGDPDVNTVNFKLVQALMLLLAKQLRLLERQVGVDSDWIVPYPISKVMTVSEVKITGKPGAKSTKGSTTTMEILEAAARSSKEFKLPKEGEGKPEKQGKGKRGKSFDIAGKGAMMRESKGSDTDFQFDRLFVVEKIPEDTKSPKDNILSVVSDREFKRLVKRVEHLEKFSPIPPTVMEVEVHSGKGKKSARTADSDTKVLYDNLSQGGTSAGGASSKSGKTGSTPAGAQPQKGAVLRAPAVGTAGISYDDLEEAIHYLRKELTAQIDALNTRLSGNLDLTMKMVTRTDAKVVETAGLAPRFNLMEETLRHVVDQVNSLDVGLSSQLVVYQEQISQLQHDLEKGLENLTEAMANQGESTALAEINSAIIALQNDLEKTLGVLQDLDDVQHGLHADITVITKDVEFLREAKSDRDEVADALRDKAGISDLNGLVAIDHFEAVQADLEKKIHAAYDVFYQYELVWQQALNDIFKELEGKVEINQQEALRDSMQAILNKMNAKLFEILEILGEPRTAALERQLFRDTTCLTCGSPAKMDLIKRTALPTLPSLVKPEVEHLIREYEAQEEGLEHTNPNLDIPAREYCSRYCGGSHTKIGFKKFKVMSSLGIKVQKLSKDHKTAFGTDGKIYHIDEDLCIPCNLPPNPAVA